MSPLGRAPPWWASSAFLQLPHSLGPPGGRRHSNWREGKRHSVLRARHLLAPPLWEVSCSPVLPSGSAEQMRLFDPGAQYQVSVPTGRSQAPSTSFPSYKDQLFGFRVPCSFVLPHNLAQHLRREELTCWASSSPNKCVIVPHGLQDCFSHSLLKNHNKNKYSSSQPFSQFHFFFLPLN